MVWSVVCLQLFLGIVKVQAESLGRTLILGCSDKWLSPFTLLSCIWVETLGKFLYHRFRKQGSTVIRVAGSYGKLAGSLFLCYFLFTRDFCFFIFIGDKEEWVLFISNCEYILNNHCCRLNYQFSSPLELLSTDKNFSGL